MENIGILDLKMLILRIVYYKIIETSIKFKKQKLSDMSLFYIFDNAVEIVKDRGTFEKRPKENFRRQK